MLRKLALYGALLATLFAAGMEGAVARQPRVFTDKGFTKNIGPQSNPALQHADRWARFKIAIRTDKPTYRIGDLMRITITSERNCYIMVYYVNSKGQTSVICPSAFSSRRQVYAGRPFKLADNKGNALQQNGPAGSETLQVVATDRPLDVATLTKLRDKLAQRPVATRPPTPRPQPAHTTIPPRPRPAPVRSSAPPAVSPAVSPSPGRSGGDGDFDDDAAASPTMPAESVPSTVGDTTPITADDEFVDQASKAIEQMVVTRSKSIASRYKNIGPSTRFTPRDGVYGLSSVTYQVKP